MVSLKVSGIFLFPPLIGAKGPRETLKVSEVCQKTWKI